MKHTDEQHQGTSKDTERSPTLTINHIPDELLLEIFDSYRQAIDHSDQEWNREYAWFNLAQVCRKWRTVMFASASRLDLGISVGPEKPGHIDTILSGPWPIFIDYKFINRGITGSALQRMRDVLMHHHDRVRKISFGGKRANFDEFFKATNCTLPLLEALSLLFSDDYEPKIPDTFLRGPDLSDLRLRSLSLHGSVALASISGFLLSAKALTDLSLLLGDTAFRSSSETTLLTCLQGLPCLRRFDLFISLLRPLNFPSQFSTTKDIVLLSKLTCLYYIGPGILLDALVTGLSAPSLRDANIHFPDATLPPIVHLPRFINEIEEHYYSVHVTFQGSFFRLSFLTQSESIGHCYPRFTLSLNMCYIQETIMRQEKIMRMSSALSTRLATMEELRVTFDRTNAIFWENFIPWRRFLWQLHNVKTLRMEDGNSEYIARILLQDDQGPDDALAFLPALEEIKLVENPSLTNESQRGPELTAFFEPFVSARQQANRPVKVFLSP